MQENNVITTIQKNLEPFSESNPQSSINCNCKEQIESQIQLIDSLRIRIEELEIDSIIKNQEIKKLQQGFDDLFKFNKLRTKETINKDYEDAKWVDKGSNWRVKENDLKSSVMAAYLESENSSPSIYQENQETIVKLEQLHSQIQIITQENLDDKISLGHLRFLKDSFTNDHLIRYTKSDHFNSLGKRIKRLLNLLIYESLSEEFQQKNIILSQDLKEYTERGIIPELPKGCNCYREYEKSILFGKLNKNLKERVRKLIKIEKRLNTKKEN